MGALYPRQTNYMFADLLFFTSKEGDEETSPSFATYYAAIEASNALLAVLIATLLPIGGTAKEATFLTAMKLLIAAKSLFSGIDGERATPPSCTSIGAYNALL